MSILSTPSAGKEILDEKQEGKTYFAIVASIIFAEGVRDHLLCNTALRIYIPSICSDYVVLKCYMFMFMLWHHAMPGILVFSLSNKISL